jgi:hypothetical protein
MSIKTTIILVLVLVVVGGIYLYAPTRRTEEAQEARKAQTAGDSTRIFDKKIKADEIQTITIEPAGETALRFERQADPARPNGPGQWQMTAPHTALAESWQVDSLTRLLADLEFHVKFTSGDAKTPSPVDTGLDSPRLVVRFTTGVDEAAQEHTLSIGKNVPLGTGSYARLATDDSPLYITSADLNERIKTKLADYRSKSVMRFLPAQANRLEITYDGVRYNFAKNNAGQWMINAPVNAAARSSELTALLGNFSRLRAVDFVDEDASAPAYGFAEPFVTARVTVTEQAEDPAGDAGSDASDPNAVTAAEPSVPVIVERQFEFAIGAPSDLQKTKRFARRPDESGVFTLEQNAIDKLRPQLSKLRDNAVTHLAVETITALKLSTGDRELSITRSDGAWTTAASFGQLDRQAMREWSNAIATLKASDYVDEPDNLADFGLDNPRATITITRSDSPDNLTLEVGERSASGLHAFAKIAGRPTVYVVSADAADEIAIDPISLSSRELFTFQPDQLARLTLDREAMHYVFDQAQPGAWSLLAPEGTTSNMPNIFGAVTDLTRLRAVRVLNPAMIDLDPNLPAAEMTLTLTLRDEPIQGDPANADVSAIPTQDYTLRVQELDGRILSRRLDSPVLYELDRTVYDAFRKEMIATKLFEFAAEDITGYRIIGPHNKLHLLKAEQGWREATDEFIPLDQAKIDELLSALAGIEVERYTAFGNADLDAFESPAITRIEIRHNEDQLTTLLLTGIDQPVAWVEAGHSFTLPLAQVQLLLRPLDNYIKPAADK